MEWHHTKFLCMAIMISAMTIQERLADRFFDRARHRKAIKVRDRSFALRLGSTSVWSILEYTRKKIRNKNGNNSVYFKYLWNCCRQSFVDLANLINLKIILDWFSVLSKLADFHGKSESY